MSYVVDDNANVIGRMSYNSVNNANVHDNVS